MTDSLDEVTDAAGKGWNHGLDPEKRQRAEAARKEVRLRAVTDLLVQSLDFIEGDSPVARARAAYNMAGRITHLLRRDMPDTVAFVRQELIDNGHSETFADHIVGPFLASEKRATDLQAVHDVAVLRLAKAEQALAEVNDRLDDRAAALGLLDDPRLRQALDYLNECGADEVLGPLQQWFADRDFLLVTAK